MVAAGRLVLALEVLQHRPANRTLMPRPGYGAADDGCTRNGAPVKAEQFEACWHAHIRRVVAYAERHVGRRLLRHRLFDLPHGLANLGLGVHRLAVRALIDVSHRRCDGLTCAPVEASVVRDYLLQRDVELQDDR